MNQPGTIVTGNYPRGMVVGKKAATGIARIGTRVQFLSFHLVDKDQTEKLDKMMDRCGLGPFEALRLGKRGVGIRNKRGKVVFIHASRLMCA